MFVFVNVAALGEVRISTYTIFYVALFNNV